MRTDRLSVSTGAVSSALLPTSRPNGGAEFDAHLPLPTGSPSMDTPGICGLGAIALPAFFHDFDDRTERRRRALQRGASMLDLLGLLQHAALTDDATPSDLLDRLAAALRADCAPADPMLESLLDEIETRAEIELARRGR